ncbi:MAG: transposase, partial [Pyrinomonadaceae bacterium]
RQLNGLYTQRFNRRHQRVGHLLQGRFKAILVERDPYLLELCRYVVLNPVRGKCVRHPKNWAWSSYRASAGIIAPPPFLATDWLLSQFVAGKVRAQEKYREFVLAGRHLPSIWKDLHGQIY